jgi:hypothetical protein
LTTKKVPPLPAQLRTWAISMQQAYGNRATAAALGRTSGGAAGLPQRTERSPGASASIRVRSELVPHSSPDAVLRAQAPIYRGGRTPIMMPDGRVESWDIRPATAAQTGPQLDNIAGRFGQAGLDRTLHGLTLSRGSSFTADALQHAPAAATMRTGTDPPAASQETALGGDVSAAIRASAAGSSLPGSVLSRAASQGHSFADVRVHHDGAAEDAAARLGARAFTIGRDIYFGRDEYRPSTREGVSLLAHELAHTEQQRGASVPAPEHLAVTRPDDAEEAEADRFARAFGSGVAPLLTRHGSAGVARIQRAITFTRSNDRVATGTLSVVSTASDYAVPASTPPLFSWTADATIHGSPGDPFGNFEVGPLQVVRHLNFNAYWGRRGGGDGTHRDIRVGVARDEVPGSGSPWYSNSRASAAYGADNEVRSTTLADAPFTAAQPWTNPIAGRSSDVGWFNYGAGFVGYISARDKTAGVGARAYRALGHIYWATSIIGEWDSAQPFATRMTTTGGGVNTGDVYDGASSEFPSMHGGQAALAILVASEKTT